MPADQYVQHAPVSPWESADAAFAALETALKAAAVESTSDDGFTIATNHLRKITDMRARFGARRPVVERTGKGG